VLNLDLQRLIRWTFGKIIIHHSSFIIHHSSFISCQLSAVVQSTRKASWGLYGEPASDLDIAISRGRLKLDSQDRYARRKTPLFYQSPEIRGWMKVRLLALDGF
jgi:hypothetical protein